MKTLKITITQQDIDTCKQYQKCPIEMAITRKNPQVRVKARYHWIAIYELKTNYREQYQINEEIVNFMKAFDNAGHVWPREFIVYQEE
jgi:hypothetical protein